MCFHFRDHYEHLIMIEMYVRIGFNFCLGSSLDINKLNNNKKKSLLLYFFVTIIFTIYYVDIGAIKVSRLLLRI